MARIVSATIPIQAGPIERQLRIGSRFRYMRIDGLELRVFAEVPNPSAPTEVRKFHLVQANVDAAVNPERFDYLGAVTTAAGVDWFLYERLD